MPGSVTVGVDVGGTFTDVVAKPSGGGALRAAKVLSTPDPSEALARGLQAVLHRGETLAQLTYGTTIVTNTVVEGRGARVALVTTRGFRDVLEIARQQRDHLYRLDAPGRQPPVVPRRWRFEVTERVDHEGRVLVPLIDSEVAAVAERLRDTDVEAVAVSFLHSYANPAHEQRAGALLRTVLPYVCLSSDVDPEVREYERTHTTCVNAQLMPVVDRFLDALLSGLARNGVESPLRLMQSNGGMATPVQARRVPLALLMSGPAGGVAAARAVARRVGVADAVALDMGGTSTDVCLIRAGAVATLAERRVGGSPVRLRSVAVESIGAGGGSIAWVDRAGALRVGPHSAGAEPGPACYGRGGEEPTVTDAYVVLGLLDPEGTLGGLHLQRDRAWKAVERIGQRFGLSAPEAAAGIVEIATATMGRAVRLVSVQRGVDPRHLVLVAYGGAGPLHAGRLAARTGMPRVLVPPYSSLFSAYGCLVADLRYDAGRTLRFRLDDTQRVIWEDAFRRMESQLLLQMADEGLPTEEALLSRAMDLRYVGQNYELEIPVEPGMGSETIRHRFTDQHRRQYEYATDEPIEGVALRVTATVPSGDAEDGTLRQDAAAPQIPRPVTTREVYVYGHGWVRAPVYRRDEVGPGTEVVGPALVEDRWSTLLVEPGHVLRTGPEGVLWVEVL